MTDVRSRLAPIAPVGARLFAILLSASLALPAARCRAASGDIYNLGTFGTGNTFSAGVAINNSGVVVGESYTPAQSGATKRTLFKWSLATGMQSVAGPIFDPQFQSQPT